MMKAMLEEQKTFFPEGSRLLRVYAERINDSRLLDKARDLDAMLTNGELRKGQVMSLIKESQKKGERFVEALCHLWLVILAFRNGDKIAATIADAISAVKDLNQLEVMLYLLINDVSNKLNSGDLEGAYIVADQAERKAGLTHDRMIRVEVALCAANVGIMFAAYGVSTDKLAHSIKLMQEYMDWERFKKERLTGWLATVEGLSNGLVEAAKNVEDEGGDIKKNDILREAIRCVDLGLVEISNVLDETLRGSLEASLTSIKAQAEALIDWGKGQASLQSSVDKAMVTLGWDNVKDNPIWVNQLISLILNAALLAQQLGYNDKETEWLSSAKTYLTNDKAAVEEAFGTFGEDFPEFFASLGYKPEEEDSEEGGEG